MEPKSNFESDLKKEQLLTTLLDDCYRKYLNHYHFDRIYDLNKQHQGIDLIFTDKRSGQLFIIDEKAQLDYINEDLPTFAFELSYEKNRTKKQGWLYDTTKKPNFIR